MPETPSGGGQIEMRYWRSLSVVVAVGAAVAAAFQYTDRMPESVQALVGRVMALKNEVRPAANANEARPSGAARQGFPVAVAPVVARPVPVTLGTIGTVEAKASVAVKSRVDGQILKAFFSDGHAVRKGDMLFAIDPAPFEAQLHQVEAFLARDRAQYESARTDMDRYQTLANKGIATQQKYDEARAAVSALEATLRADQAAVESARLMLSFTSIRSPIDGRAGSILVHPGNLVKANDANPLVVINQMRPIDVAFSVPERYLPEIGRRMAQAPLAVEARLPNLGLPPVKGKLTFINNAVNQSTGTIQLKGTFDNTDEALVPGQFIDVVLTVSVIPDALVIPNQALQTGQIGTYVYVVRPDQTAELRPVTVRTMDDGQIVVESGLKSGETVVTEGQMRLTPGARVSVKVSASS